jgi:tRNA threonylcarbamoyladenosine biosynthesis protein TsaE
MKVVSGSVAQTIDLGRKIAKVLTKGDIVCLFGSFGSGKTVLTKGIGWGLGLKGNNILSPSFVLVRQYNQIEPALFHFDFYRLQTPGDILSLGYEEYFYNAGITVIEWADRLKYLLPAEYLKVELFIKSNSERLLKFKAQGRHYEKLLKKLYENIRH